MSTPMFIASVIIVALIVVVGLIYTFKQFSDMNDDPESYRFDRSEEPDVAKKDSDSID